MHEEKIKIPFNGTKTLNDNEEDGIPLIDKLSMEQDKVEKWISKSITEYQHLTAKSLV